MAGTRNTSIRSYTLYREGNTPMTDIFADLEIDFIDQMDETPFISQGIILVNDNGGGGADITFSYDGTTIHGRAKAGDILSFDYKRETKIFLKSVAISPFRLWCW